jgi:hypothetical protein
VGVGRAPRVADSVGCSGPLAGAEQAASAMKHVRATSGRSMRLGIVVQ